MRNPTNRRRIKLFTWKNDHMHDCKTHYWGAQEKSSPVNGVLWKRASVLVPCAPECGDQAKIHFLKAVRNEKLKECLIFCNRWTVFVAQHCLQVQCERLRHAYVAEVSTASQEPRHLRLSSQQATLHLGMAQLPSVSLILTLFLIDTEI